MNRKLASRFIIVIVGLIIFILIFRIYRVVQHKEVIAQRVTFLDSLVLLNLDSTMYTIPHKMSKLVLIHFNSTCEHCQEEARSILTSASSFNNASLIFISTESLTDINTFESQWHLMQLKNIAVVKMNAEDLYHSFGVIAVPSIYIYNEDKKLVKEFRGETKVEAILKYL